MNTIMELRQKLNNYKTPKTKVTIQDIFEHGDFEETEPGDAYVYWCGEDGHGYHQYYINWQAETVNGKQILTCQHGDEDGNWDVVSAWETGEDPAEILAEYQNQSDEYFLGWAKYYLDCAETGLDMLLLPAEKRVNKKQMIKNALEDINYLFMGEPA